MTLRLQSNRCKVKADATTNVKQYTQRRSFCYLFDPNCLAQVSVSQSSSQNLLSTHTKPNKSLADRRLDL
eukprot:853432-Amphidinium_carterae.1